MWVAYSGNGVHVDVYTGEKVSKNQVITEKIDTLHFKNQITLIDYVRVGRQLNILKDEYTKVVITK